MVCWYGFYSLKALQKCIWMGSAGIWSQFATGDLPTEVPPVPDVKNNIKKVLGKNPFGLSGSSFLMIYESCVGQLNLKQLQCKDLVELSCCRTVVCPSSVLCRGVVVLGGGDCTASWGDGLQRYQ